MALRYHYSRKQTATADRRHTTNPANQMPASSTATSFQQPCPTCGRVLLILVQHLGQEVFCTHCRSRFVSFDESQNRHGGSIVGRTIMERAEHLLARLESSS